MRPASCVQIAGENGIVAVCMPTSGKVLVSWVNGGFFSQLGLYLEKDVIQAIIPNSRAFRSISQAPERSERNWRRLQ